MPSLRPVWAMLNSFHSAEFDQHVGGGLRAAGGFAAHDAGQRFDTVLVGDDADVRIERVGAAVQRQQGLAVARAPHGEVAPHLRGVEHMQRPGAVVGHEVGDVDQRVDRAQPDRDQPLLQPFRRRAVFDAAHQTHRKTRTQTRILDRQPHRTGEFAPDLLDAGIPEFAHVGGGQVPRDAVHAGAILPVRRQVDLQHGIADPGPLRVTGANRRVRRQLHDAVMVLGNLQFGGRAQHAAALDAADGADAERDVLAGNEGAGRREYTDKSRARIRRAADHLHGCRTVAGIDHADAKPVGIGMLLGGNHPRDRERRQRPGLVVDVLDLEPDHGELVGQLFQRLVGVEMLLEPGEREFHGVTLWSASISTSRKRSHISIMSSLNLPCRPK